MKYLIGILALLSISSTLYAQGYTPMLGDQSVWVHQIFNLGINDNDKLTADSAHVISGETVHRLQVLQPSYLNDVPMSLGLFHEDTLERTLSWYPPGTDSLHADSAYLMYDFGMAVGDTGTFTEFHALFYPGNQIEKNPIRLRLDSTRIDTISWDGPGFDPVLGNKFFLTHVDDVIEASVIWLEGVGNLIHVMKPAGLAAMFELVCFTKDSVRTYAATDVWLPLPDFFCYSDLVLSVKEPVSAGFTIYPNPTRKLVQVEWREVGALSRFSLLNQAGQRIRSISVPFAQTSFSVSLEGLPAGLYVLLGEGPKGLFSQKVLKQ